MAISYKAIAFANDLASTLNARLNGALTFAVSADTDGQPMLTAGAGTAGAENVVLKLSNYLVAQNAAATTAGAPTPYKDELGLAANPFSPTIAQLTTEASGTATLGTGTNASATVLITAGGAGAEGVVVAGTTVTAVFAGTAITDATALVTALNANAKVNKLGTASNVAGTSATVTFTAKPGLGTLANSFGWAASAGSTHVTAASGAGYMAGGTVTGGNAGASSLVSLADLFKILGEVFGRGTIVEMYLSAAGTAPSSSNGTLVASFTMSAQYPAMSVN